MQKNVSFFEHGVTNMLKWYVEKVERLSNDN